MIRSLSLAIAGCISGLAVAHFGSQVIIADPLEATEKQPPTDSVSSVALVTRSSEERTAGYLSEEYESYLAASLLGSPAELRAAIRDLLNDADGTTAKVSERLEALLLRLVELDAEGAASLIEELAIGESLAVEVYRAWARRSPDSAIERIGRLTDRDLARTLALGVTTIVGGSAASIDELIAIFSGPDRQSFELALLVELSAVNPMAAIERANRMVAPQFQRRALREVAAQLAVQNPENALTYASMMDSALMKHAFQIGVASEWMSWDPEAAVNYLINGDGRQLFAFNDLNADMLLEKLSGIRSEALLNGMHDLRMGRARSLLESFVMRQIIARDPLAAAEHAEALSSEIDRRSWYSQIATELAASEPEAAVEWAQALESTSPELLGLVVAEIASTDLQWATDIALSRPAMSGRLLENVIHPAQLARTPAPDIAALAERLSNTGVVPEGALDRLLQVWPLVDSDSAIAWAVEQNSLLSTENVRSLALGFAQVAQAGIEVPVSVVNQVPVEHRAVWIGGVAPAYIAANPEAGLRWLESFQSEPEYDGWVSAAALALVERNDFTGADQAMAAEVLDAAAKPTDEAVLTVSTRWALQDPRAAAQWAEGITDPDVRSTGVAAAAGVWTVSDPDAAKRWIAQYPESNERDRALGAILAQEIASHASVDDELVRSFSSNSARNRAFGQTSIAFTALGSREPERAIGLVNEYVTDDALRAQILSEIDRVREAGFEYSADGVLIAQ